ncbi:hypothetical protein B0J11DRAFT_618965 [Dendryphion nanum]|uniref:N-acetyltransferase domain-containing protein n=1 Tax=Dendryphion nanum TaxID=256645 RepID=A0A9P9D7Y8_9PLEO|nr:hypothetical protein B0J11DRAFT_618965 [Dendryphion nanum]
MSSNKIHLLPKTHPDPAVWSRLVRCHKCFRLQSLQMSPESFSSSYQREATFSDVEWEARLQNPLASSFTAIKMPGNNVATDRVEELANAQWLGMAVLYGPLEPASSESDSSVAKLHFEIFALYVLPDARGSGIGKSLIDAAIAHGRLLGRGTGTKEVVIHISVTPGNTKVLKLYQGLGFIDAGVAKGGESGIRRLSITVDAM